MPDSLAAVRGHGTVCFTGMLSDQWTVRDFHPIGYLPNGVRLTAYSGDAADLPAAVLQGYLDRIASGEISLGPVHVYRLDDIQVAHRDLEEGWKVGKLVLVANARTGHGHLPRSPERVMGKWMLSEGVDPRA